jgi:hypothetical protein
MLLRVFDPELAQGLEDRREESQVFARRVEQVATDRHPAIRR